MVSVRPHPFCFPRPSSPSFAVMLFVVMMMAAGCGDDSARSITAPSDAVIQINIAQPFIVANATMQIALVLQRMDSSPVDDGTEVSLSVTAGSLTQQTVQTVNGTATVNYQASSEAGTATLTVRSGGASATIALTVVSAAVSSVAVTASPRVLPPGGGETDITATVTGTGGTPVVGVPVRFETSAGTAGVTDTTSDSAGVARTTVSTTVAAMVRAIVEGLAPAEVLVRIQAILSVAMAASSTAVTEGDSVTFNIAATSSDGAAATGTLTVDLGDGRSVTVIDFLSTTTVTETYSSAGSYAVTAQLVSDDGSTGTANVALSVAPRPILSVTLSASPTTPQVDETVVFTVGGTSTVGASATGVGAAATGTLVLDYGDGTSTIVGFEDSATTTKTYSAAGTYTVNAELTATDGRVANATLSLTIDEAPTPPGPGSGGDEIDLSTVTWLHHDVSRWPETSTLTEVDIRSNDLCLSHTKAGQWPRNGDGWEGNPWIFAKVDGQWYAGTYEWLRPGQICKSIDAGNIGSHIKQAPLDASWRPQSGQTYGFMLSTPAREDVAVTPHERSNVVLMTWP